MSKHFCLEPSEFFSEGFHLSDSFFKPLAKIEEGYIVAITKLLLTKIKELKYAFSFYASNS